MEILPKHDTKLFVAYFRSLNYFAPLLNVRAHEGIEFGGRAGEGIHAVAREFFFHRRRQQCAADFAL